MLGFFRRIINSRWGVVITLVFLGVIALAFAAGDVTGLAGRTGVLGSSLVSVGGEGVSATDLRRQAEQQLKIVRQQNPAASMQGLVAAGGIEALIDRTVNGLAFFHFGEDQGMAVSRALIGSELKSIPAFQGATGQFDQAAYERAIAQSGQTDAQVQRDVAREQMAQFLVGPTIGASQVSRQLALPYASLLLEKRRGQVAVIPVAPTGAAPSDAELTAWYKGHVAAYTIPERRIAKYAIVSPESVAARATPTDADLQQAYRAAGARFQAKQVRDVTLVTVLSQAGAQALANKVKGGQDVAAAARTSGLEARTLAAQDKAALAAQTSAAVADAAFAAPAGGVVGPVKGAIGFVVAKIGKVVDQPGKSFAQARAELVTEVTKAKTADALSQAQSTIDDALSDRASITEVAADQKLTLATTPALLANGADPENASVKPDPKLAQVLSAAFAAEEGDTPTMVPVAQDGSFAVVALDRVVHPTPMPLERIRARVAQDLTLDRARRAAKASADAVVAQVGKGTPLAAAMAQGKVAGKVQPLEVSRAQLNANRNGVDPVLATLFTMKRGTARAVALANGRGWAVVTLGEIVPGDASKQQVVIDATRADIGRAIGEEYVRQFAHAVAGEVGVKRNDGAIAQLKKDLAGGGASDD